ncbi:hypothetical protein [Prevotella sp.]|uniref:hypothetical protein n=1 Tax=Prevotella sp. TaxID=59823 RepID=UPI003DA38A58
MMEHLSNILNKLLVILCLITLVGCASPRIASRSHLYSSFMKCHKGDTKFIMKYRKKIHFFDDIKYNPQQDTIYIMELYGIIGELSVTIWNKSSSISYEDQSLNKTNEPQFDNYMIRLVESWNIEKLINEGESHGLLPQYWIYVSRVMIKNNRVKIECDRFKDFYKGSSQ